MTLDHRRVALHNAILNNLAIANGNNASGAAGNIPVMGDNNQCDALAVEFIKEPQDFGPRLGVQRTGWFVGQEQMGTVDQGAGNGDTLLLSTRKLVRAVIGTVAKPHATQRLQRTLAASPFDTPIKEGQLHLAAGRSARQQVKALKDKANFAVA